MPTIAFLDFFVMNIALPAMRADRGANPAELQLVIAAYGIGFGVFLVTGGRLADIFGRRRMFLLGITAFTLASPVCGLAPTALVLIPVRALQSVTAATLVPQVLAIVRVGFARREHPLAVGLTARRSASPRSSRRSWAARSPALTSRTVVAADLPGQYHDRAGPCFPFAL